MAVHGAVGVIVPWTGRYPVRGQDSSSQEREGELDDRGSIHSAHTTLPCLQALDEHTRDIARRASARAQARLLLVEPDAAIADLVAAILTDEGYAVDHLARPDAVGAYLASRGCAACDLVLSTPYADPLQAPYAWLDALRRATPPCSTPTIASGATPLIWRSHSPPMISSLWLPPCARRRHTQDQSASTDTA